MYKIIYFIRILNVFTNPPTIINKHKYNVQPLLLHVVLKENTITRTCFIYTGASIYWSHDTHTIHNYAHYIHKAHTDDIRIQIYTYTLCTWTITVYKKNGCDILHITKHEKSIN